MLAFTFLFPVPKPPPFAQALAAGAVARKLTKALIAGVSRKATSRSPPISTAPAFGPGLIVGNTAALKPDPAFAFVDDRIAPPTKSASNTIAPLDGVENASVTHVGKSVWSAPLEPPARFELSPMICPISVSAVFTDGSVHLILCVLSDSYCAGPNV